MPPKTAKGPGEKIIKKRKHITLSLCDKLKVVIEVVSDLSQYKIMEGF